MKYFHKYIVALSLIPAMVSCKFDKKEIAISNDVSAKSHWTDEQLLDTIQYQTFEYFWEGAEPNSGMARERLHMDDVYPTSPKNTVTIGGSGFGLMAILVGVERGFITRKQALDRFVKIVDFLEKADRFHGAWPHWLNGETGKVHPFSKKDDGGDLVETAFLV
ncbi:MAG: beta-glucosidase, partial [Mangrovimonas sp.]|nr:beta-glucosidase [Mangrovimonas sp.]